MRLVATLLLLASVAVVASPANAQVDDPPAAAADPEVTAVIVELDDHVPAVAMGRLLDLVAGSEIEIIESYDNLGLLALDVTPTGRDLLASSSIVESLTPARTFELFLDESVPSIGVTDLHMAGHTGAGRVVAVLDSGVGASMVGSVVAEACFLQGTPTSSPSTLVEGCGNDTSLLSGSSAIPCTILPEACSHGTHVAGIISGDHPTFTGVAPDADLISIRVTAIIDEDDADPLDPVAYIPEAGVLAGLEHVIALAATMDIAAVNLSLGGAPGTCQAPHWDSVVADLGAEGIAVVAASGNSGPSVPVAFPACLDGVVAVGASTPSTEVASFTQYLGQLDLVAPGVGVDSTVLIAYDASGFAAFSGTSMAAPHVAGAFALVYGTQSGWSVERYTELMRASGVMVAKPTADPRDPRFPELRPVAVIDFTPFTDADVGFWVIASDWAKATGVSTGPGGGVFDPDSTLTRAEAVTFLWRMMGGVTPSILNPFGDVPADTWFTNAVVWAFEVGVTTGTGFGNFEPSGSVTRGQLAAFMWRLAGHPAVGQTSGFTDVFPADFYAAAVDWLAWYGITTGTTATTFSPDDIVTRAQMVTFMWRLANASQAWTGSVDPPDSVLF